MPLDFTILGLKKRVHVNVKHVKLKKLLLIPVGKNFISTPTLSLFFSAQKGLQLENVYVYNILYKFYSIGN